MFWIYFNKLIVSFKFGKPDFSGDWEDVADVVALAYLLEVRKILNEINGFI